MNRLSYILFLLFFALRIPLKSQVYFLRDTFCADQLIVINGSVYGPNRPTGTEIIPGGAANGGDSIIEVRLVFLKPALTRLTGKYCVGDTVWVNGVPYHAGYYIGKEIIEGGATNGCDSIIEVDLRFFPRPIVDIVQPLCDGDTLWVNGKPYSAFKPTGVEIIPGGAVGGCDSIIRVNLTIIPLPFFELVDTLCPDEVRIINGQRYDRLFRSGVEILKGASSTGCDSILYVRFFFRNSWMSLGEDQEVYYGTEACLEPLFSFKPVSLSWTPSIPCASLSCLPYCKTFQENAQYRLEARDPYGCILRDTISIRVRREAPVYAPNVFAPQGDWPNNRFFLSASPGVVQINRMFIANRWGEIVYEQNNFQPNIPGLGWDGSFRGQEAPPDVYLFWAELLLWDGRTEVVSGSVALVR
ncbi:MAG: gliding motility-associated C-terminal domain-containing protein [Saprospiraceae bacterium]|nr:gliding motility-associated C-terminal domain-containing protein [Saprospiraceae bacterium]MDW8483996.1 gliding motility-associated C-terminal domain-containing protein [Saprospiraceae bacterium]